MEGCVVRLADRIAYSGRDYEDALSVFKVMPPLPKAVIHILGKDNRTIINNLVTDMIRTNLETPERIGFSDVVFDAFRQLYAYNCKNIYYHPLLKDYAVKAENMLATIFDFEQRELSARRQNQWGMMADKDSPAVQELHHFIQKMYGKRDRPSLSQIIVDHMSLMTDRYARSYFQDIFMPKPVG